MAQAFPRRPRVPGRRRRARPSAGRRAGHEHQRAGRLQPRLEARPGAAPRRARRAARHLRGRSGCRSRRSLLEFVVQMHKDWLGKAKDKEEPRKGEHMQLSLNYRGGPLSVDERPQMRGGRDAGRRPRARCAADRRCRRAGSAVRHVPRAAFHAAGVRRRGLSRARCAATRDAVRVASRRPAGRCRQRPAR